jgi:hypothetical protein
MISSALDCIVVDASPLVHDLYAMVDGAVCVTLRVEMVVSTPAITDDRSAGFNPRICNGHQIVGGSVRNGNKKHFTGLTLNTAKHPLPLNRVASAIFAPTQVALSISTILLGPQIFWEQTSMYTSTFSLQNWPQSRS